MLGQEALLEAVAKSFGVKIFVDKNELANYYGDLEVVAPDFLTDNNESTRFEVLFIDPYFHKNNYGVLM